LQGIATAQLTAKLLAGLVIFTVFTAASGFINSLLGIYITQGLAGCGTALAIPSSLGIIAANFPMGKARVFAYAAFGASGPAGN
jgi:MFS family permease